LKNQLKLLNGPGPNSAAHRRLLWPKTHLAIASARARPNSPRRAARLPIATSHPHLTTPPTVATGLVTPMCAVHRASLSLCPYPLSAEANDIGLPLHSPSHAAAFSALPSYQTTEQPPQTHFLIEQAHLCPRAIRPRTVSRAPRQVASSHRRRHHGARLPCLHRWSASPWTVG
jgi:hypothetical protein